MEFLPDTMTRGFVYLAVVLDWASRRVLSWRLSITMEAAFCVETLEDAMAHHGKPEIFNTDQGSQFTGSAFTGVLAKRHCDQHGRQGRRLAGQRLQSSGCRAAASTRRSISEPTTMCPRRAPPSGAASLLQSPPAASKRQLGPT